MERVILWGTGEVARNVFNDCMTLEQYDILGIVDNDKSKQGGFFHGFKVYAPEIIMAWKSKIDKIIILTKAYEEIRSQILSMDISFGKLVDNEYYFYKQSIMKRYSDCRDEQIKEILDYLDDHEIDVFNYNFVEKYKEIKPDILFDEKSGLFYIKHNGFNMYFSRELNTEKKVLEYYQSILMEQDEMSPHRYIDKDFDVKEFDVVVDVGVAEGNFTIDIINRAKKIYLIESDPLWIEALNYTFEDYMDKICIIEKYVSSYDEGKVARLDSIIDEKIDFMKIDIEGCEHEALIGGRNLLKKSKNIKMAICCYHSDFDQILIEHELDKQGLKYTTTDGYMWYPHKNRQSTVSTQLHRGIIRAFKTNINYGRKS